MVNEIWKAIPGWENRYEVSNHGRVRSLNRSTPSKNRHGQYCTRHYKGRVLVAGPGKLGYPVVTLSSGVKEQTRFAVHRLVAELFIGPPPPGTQVCHNNGDPLDNQVTNLRWGSAKENAADKMLHGTQPMGEATVTAVLTEDDVHWIRRNSTKTLSEMSAILNVSSGTVQEAKTGGTWKHLEGAVSTTPQREQGPGLKNTSGALGVYWDKSKKGRWRAQITVGKKKINLGSFQFIEDAIAARAAGEEEYWK
jgi:hypothetical protein